MDKKKPFILNTKQLLHHASMQVNLVNLVLGTFDIATKYTVALANQSVKAAVVTTTVENDRTAGVTSPSVTSTSRGPKEMSNILGKKEGGAPYHVRFETEQGANLFIKLMVRYLP
jgi:hypothetical protein